METGWRSWRYSRKTYQIAVRKEIPIPIDGTVNFLFIWTQTSANVIQLSFTYRWHDTAFCFFSNAITETSSVVRYRDSSDIVFFQNSCTVFYRKFTDVVNIIKSVLTKEKKKHQTVLCVNNETSFWKSDSRFLPQDLISDTFSPISDPPFSTGVEPIPILDTISSAWKALPYYICWETHQYLWANIAIDKGTTLFLQLWLIRTISSISCVLVCVCLVTVNWIFCT